MCPEKDIIRLQHKLKMLSTLYL